MTPKYSPNFKSLFQASAPSSRQNSGVLRRSMMSLVSGTLLSLGACTVAGDPSAQEFTLTEHCAETPDDSDCSFCEDNASDEFCAAAAQPGFCVEFPGEGMCASRFEIEIEEDANNPAIKPSFALTKILDLLKLNNLDNHTDNIADLKKLIKTINQDKAGGPPPKGALEPLAKDDVLNSGRMKNVIRILRVENVDKHRDSLEKILIVLKNIEIDKGKANKKGPGPQNQNPNPNNDGPKGPPKPIDVNPTVGKILDLLKLANTDNHTKSIEKLKKIVADINADKANPAPVPGSFKPLAENDQLNSGRMMNVRKILKIENVDKHISNLRRMLLVFKEIELDKGKQGGSNKGEQGPGNKGEQGPGNKGKQGADKGAAGNKGAKGVFGEFCAANPQDMLCKNCATNPKERACVDLSADPSICKDPNHPGADFFKTLPFCKTI